MKRPLRGAEIPPSTWPRSMATGTFNRGSTIPCTAQEMKSGPGSMLLFATGQVSAHAVMFTPGRTGFPSGQVSYSFGG